ncbi:hypothetical protein ACFLQN_04795 [Candidatus Aenigmatarchaeota archaeon]
MKPRVRWAIIGAILGMLIYIVAKPILLSLGSGTIGDIYDIAAQILLRAVIGAIVGSIAFPIALKHKKK